MVGQDELYSMLEGLELLHSGAEGSDGPGAGCSGGETDEHLRDLLSEDGTCSGVVW